ncbi:MAG: phage tail sheath family protein, partial [Actinobacteria bacterium]|nr:phage tail sheath family protein [Actinomycetota bacterium]
MPTYAAPGVYVEEVPSAQKVLTAAATAIAAFVGFTSKSPEDDPSDPEGLKPRLVTSWTQFEELYGG